MSENLEMTSVNHSDRLAAYILLGLALFKVILHCAVNMNDTFFRDEYYYMACGNHLGFGYVDHPPGVALVAAFSRLVFGNSVAALRLLPAIVGGAFVFLAGKLTKEFGGNFFAQVFTAVAVIAVPVYLSIDGYFSMNVFDHFLWLLTLYILALLIKKETPLLWLLWGLVMGIALEFKISMLFLGLGLFIGILLTPLRRWLIHKWIWISAAIASILFLPYILWQITNGWATLEFMHNARLYKNAVLSPLQFFLNLIIEGNLFLAPLMGIGLGWFFISKEGKSFRIIGWSAIVVFIVLTTMNGKTYYYSPFYAPLLAAGAVALEGWIAQYRLYWIRPLLFTIVIISGFIMLPLALPVLSPQTYIKYSKMIGIKSSAGERGKQSSLPQFFADRYGWEEMVQKVAQVYHSLPEEERKKCVIFVTNYGEAGAIDYYRAKYDLPKAVCNHNSYYLWGPGDKPWDIVITFAIPKEKVDLLFESVELTGVVIDNPYAMPYERGNEIGLCRGCKVDINELWPTLKHFM